MSRKFTIAVILTIFCMGCGYSFSPGGEHIDSRINKVFVGQISNRTGEANVENYIRNALFNRIRKSNRFKPVANIEDADAVLSGKITNISTSHLAYSSSDVAKEDRVLMTLDLEFKRTDNGDIIWMSSGFSEKEAYGVDQNTSTTAKNKNEAIQKLSIDMADKAYRNIMSGF